MHLTRKNLYVIYLHIHHLHTNFGLSINVVSEVLSKLNEIYLNTKEEENIMTAGEKKWMWMMDYCNKEQINPSDTYWWNKVGEIYNLLQK